jgi:ABC-type sugar transport system ATPase subunit
MGITSIYVTHDQIEALTMADRIAVMNEGVLEAYDTPDDLYNMPRTLFIAGFVGNPPMNLFPVDLTTHEGIITAHADGFQVRLTGERAEKAAQYSQQYRTKLMLGIRPEDVLMQSADRDGALGGTVAIVEPLGREDMIEVRVGDAPASGSNSHAPRLVALVSTEQHIRMGDQVHLSLNMSKLHFFDLTTQHTILRA